MFKLLIFFIVQSSVDGLSNFKFFMSSLEQSAVNHSSDFESNDVAGLHYTNSEQEKKPICKKNCFFANIAPH